MMTLSLTLAPVGRGLLRPAVPAAAQTDDTITAKIGVVEIDMEQLEKDHYLVTVPVTLVNNTSFETFQCGAAWDTSQLTVLGSRSTSDGLLTNLVFSDERDFIWMSFMGNNYTGDTLCSITFQVNPNVQPGDFLVVQGENYDVTSQPAQYIGSDGGLHPVDTISGGIQIVNNVIPDVTVEISDVAVEIGDLEENGYIVEVPVKATVNNGFYGMRFGLSWDAAEMTGMSPSGDVPEGLSITPSMSASGNGWVEIYADSTYKRSALLTLRFILPEDCVPGNRFTVTAEYTSASGTEAKVINSSGLEGNLTLVSGTIQVKSNQPVSTFANANIPFPTVEVTLEDLKKNNYQISYPISIVENSALTELSFGASWDSNYMQIADCVCDDQVNLELNQIPSRNKDAIWLPFTYQGTGAAYQGTALCTITFQISETAAVGDVYDVTATEMGFNGAEGAVINVKGENGMMVLKSGCVKIVSDEEKTAQIRLEIEDTTVNADDLYLTDNEVSVPIVIHQNTMGLTSVSFGITWDAALAEPVEIRPVNNAVLGVKSNFEATQDGVWLTFISIDPYNDYTFTESEKTIGYLVLRLSDDIQPGDVLALYMDNVSRDGVSFAEGMTAEGLPTTPTLTNGSLRVIGTLPAESDVTTESTQWTKPTRASTTTTVSTSATTSVSDTASATDTEHTGSTGDTGDTSQTTGHTQSSATASATSTADSTSASSSISTETSPTTTTRATATTRPEFAYLSQELMTLTVGQKTSLIFYQGRRSAGTFSWVSRDPGVVRINTIGSVLTIEIEALRAGRTTVAVMCGDEIYRCEVTVIESGGTPGTSISTASGTRSATTTARVSTTTAATSIRVLEEGMGDVDNNGTTDMSDLVLLCKCVIGACNALSGESMANGDINGDGVVDCKDILELMQLLTGSA